MRLREVDELTNSLFAEELERTAADLILREPARRTAEFQAMRKQGRLATLLRALEPRRSEPSVDWEPADRREAEEHSFPNRASGRRARTVATPYVLKLPAACVGQSTGVPPVLHMTARQRHARKMVRLILRWVLLTIVLVGTVMTMALP
ncbi:MAG: hypothetical protein KAY22_17895 [Rhizorhabdus sp.]|uniref:hypothetical protein n=1 Tax=Rhizorhabdus sp. TaxID=1968843 RepID=UPI001B750870|nr:hypothetical protein [Rhizorhabdus sp.]MBP8234173.1 hypothetical protein [Rhizorhabdus sp.]